MVKTKVDNINSQLAIVMRSGKTHLGFKSTLKAIRSGKAKAIILSSNLPIIRKSELEYLAVFAKVKTITYNGNNTELGTACGKLFRISCLAIRDAGDSDILQKYK